MNQPTNSPPRWGGTPDATEHYIVACRSSALILNREGCEQEARELWNLADQAEQDLISSSERAPGSSDLPEIGHPRSAQLKAESARGLDNRRREVSTWPAG